MVARGDLGVEDPAGTGADVSRRAHRAGPRRPASRSSPPPTCSTRCARTRGRRGPRRATSPTPSTTGPTRSCSPARRRSAATRSRRSRACRRIAVEAEAHFGLVDLPEVRAGGSGEAVDDHVTDWRSNWPGGLTPTPSSPRPCPARTARLLARHRPPTAIVAPAPSAAVVRRMAVVWGLQPVLMADPDRPGAGPHRRRRAGRRRRPGRRGRGAGRRAGRPPDRGRGTFAHHSAAPSRRRRPAGGAVKSFGSRPRNLASLPRLPSEMQWLKFLQVHWAPVHIAFHYRKAANLARSGVTAAAGVSRGQIRARRENPCGRHSRHGIELSGTISIGHQFAAAARSPAASPACRAHDDSTRPRRRVSPPRRLYLRVTSRSPRPSGGRATSAASAT